MVKKITQPVRLSWDVWLFIKEEALRQSRTAGKIVTPDTVIRQAILKAWGVDLNDDDKHKGDI